MEYILNRESKHTRKENLEARICITEIKLKVGVAVDEQLKKKIKLENINSTKPRLAEHNF